MLSRVTSRVPSSCLPPRVCVVRRPLVLSGLFGRSPPSPPPPPPSRPSLVPNAHGLRVLDPFRWMEDEGHEYEGFLEAEAKHCERWLASNERARGKLTNEMWGDIVAPHLPPDIKGSYAYYSRFLHGTEVPIMCRRKLVDPSDPSRLHPDEEVVFHPQRLEGVAGYLDVLDLHVSDCESKVLVCVDLSGSEEYEARALCLRTQRELTRVKGTHTAVWCADGSIVYAKFDHNHRPFQLRRRVIGEGAKDDEDEVLYHEPDESLIVAVGKSLDNKWLFFQSMGHHGACVSAVPSAFPNRPPLVLSPMRPGVTASAEHCGNTFYLLTNEGGALDFQVLKAKHDDGKDSLHWEVMVPETNGQCVQTMAVFQNHLVLVRHGGCVSSVLVADLQTNQSRVFDDNGSGSSVVLGGNSLFDSKFLSLTLVSPISSPRHVVLDMDAMQLDEGRTRALQPAVQDAALRNRLEFERTLVCSSLLARSSDGTEVPITVVHPRTVAPNGKNPMVVQAYGAYGAPAETSLQTESLALLRRGCVLAFAHVRGGGDKGVRWHKAATLENKVRSMDDLVACVEALHQRGFSSPALTCARGSSAGAMLVASVASARPELFRAVVLESPFLDIVGAMTNPDHPLTKLEYREWGNPNEDKEILRTMLTYCPYHTLGQARPTTAQTRPISYLVCASRQDPRVPSWHAGKFVAKLRTLQQAAQDQTGAGQLLGTVVLRMYGGGGHFGVTGHGQPRQTEQAVLNQFMLDQCPVA